MISPPDDPLNATTYALEHPKLAGLLLGRGYVLLDRLGRGATADVLEVRHQATGRTVALKLTRIRPNADQIVGRMLTAWNVGRGLRHPHIVEFLDAGLLPDGRAYIAMERLHGRDLQSLLDAYEPRGIEIERAVRIGRQVAAALQVLHRRGVIHRDVKPPNVFLVGDAPGLEHVKLIDFGIVALAKGDPNRQHEKTGKVIIGSLLYLAPEIGRGRRPDARTDLYALGAMLYHCLAGRPPFDAAKSFDVVRMHLKEEPTSLHDLRMGLPDELVELVHRCLAKRQRDRPASAEEVIEVLDRCAQRLAVDVASKGEALPPVPVSGRTVDWHAFADALLTRCRARWEAPPETILLAGAGLQSARAALGRAAMAAARHRAEADLQARARIEAQSELDAELFANQLDIDEARETLGATRANVEAVRTEAAELGRQYQRSMRAVQKLAADPPGSHAIDEFREVISRMQGVLNLQARRLVDMTEARDAERLAANALAAPQMKRLELRRDRARLELTEKQDDWRREAEAQQAADAERAAQRGFEQASLGLLLAYVAER